MKVIFNTEINKERKQQHVVTLELETSELEALGWMLQDYEALLEHVGRSVAEYDAYRTVLSLVNHANCVISTGKEVMKEYEPGYDKQWDVDRLRAKPYKLPLDKDAFD